MQQPISAEAIAMRKLYRWKNHEFAQTDEQAFEWYNNNFSQENEHLFNKNFLPNVAQALFRQREQVRVIFVDMPNLRDKKYIQKEKIFKTEHINTWLEVTDMEQWEKDLKTWAKKVYDILNEEV
jgi:hypothetical protein